MKFKTTGKMLKVLLTVLMLCFIMSSVSYAEKNDSKSPVNINQASVKELSSLPGIGKKKAEAIVAYREKNGKFSSIDDIKKVDGVGKDTLEKIKGLIVLQ